MKSLNEQHDDLVADRLSGFTAGELAELLHQNYRAAAKAMAAMHKIAIGPVAHDHGWCDCYGKKRLYFLRRARWLLRHSDQRTSNGRLK